MIRMRTQSTHGDMRIGDVVAATLRICYSIIAFPISANNKLTSRCGGFCALCDPELSTYRTTSKRHLLSGRDLDDKTTSRRPRGTHEMTGCAAGLIHAHIAAREGGLNSL